MTPQPDGSEEDRVAAIARRTARRRREGRDDPEPSLGSRLGQIGILGWAIVTPILVALLIGRWLDRVLATGVMFSAAFIMIGAAFGFWSVWRWMHRQ